MYKLKVSLLLLLFSVPVIGGDTVPDRKKLDLSGLSIGFGYVTRSFNNMKVVTGSYSRRFNSPLLTGEAITVLPRSGALEGLIDRSYDNGFVGKDATGSIGEVTWYWGYEDSSQIEGDSILFKDSSARSVDHQYSSFSDESSSMDSVWGSGPLLTFAYNFSQSDKFNYSAALNFSYVNFNNTWKFSNFSANRQTDISQSIVEDTYNLLGTIPPEAPHAGAFAEPGSLIEAIPSERSLSIQDYSSQLFEFNNKIFKEFDFSLFTISPAVTTSFTIEDFIFDLGIGPSVNLIDWETNFSESLIELDDQGVSKEIAQWDDLSSGSSVVLGAFLQASASFNMNNSWTINVFARMDWADDFSANVGRSKMNFNLSGASAGFSTAYKF